MIRACFWHISYKWEIHVIVWRGSTSTDSNIENVWKLDEIISALINKGIPIIRIHE